MFLVANSKEMCENRRFGYELAVFEGYMTRFRLGVYPKRLIYLIGLHWDRYQQFLGERGEHRVKKIPRSTLQEMKRTTIDDQPPNKKFEKVAREFLEDLKDRYLEFKIKGRFF